MKPRTSETEKKAQKHKRQSSFAILLTGILVTIVFVCMSVYMVNYAKTNEKEMFDNSYNTYSVKLSKENLRGSIYSSDNVCLAYSESEDGETQTRIYPYANMYAHAIGYSTHGRLGVESLANYYLLNYHSGITNKAEQLANNEMVQSDSVYTTFDSRLQEVCYNCLGVYKGAVIVTEVKTGRILAMVSKPDFDPNNIDALWDSLVNDKENSCLLNRATQGLYPPGSTFKIITALEYIRENPNTYNDYRFNCTGSFSYEDNVIQCYHGSVHGSVDFATSFAKSCNSSFANIGVSLDREKFADTLEELMFNSGLPVDFVYNESSTAITADVDTHNLMQGSIGQGLDSVTPLHMNMITCAIANGGELMKPMMIDKVVSASGTTVKTFSPQKSKRLMTEEESEILTELMKGVVENGTASKLKGLSYSAAGKTGSAEYNTDKDDSHAWFTGFAPAEDPEIAVTIIIEGAGSGGEYAVPMAKRIFDKYFED